MYLEIYELDPELELEFLSAPGLTWQSVSKTTKVKLNLLTDIDMLLMVEEGIREGICYSIYRYAKANNKYMKDCDKNKESSYLQYWDTNNLYGWAMSEKFPVNNLSRQKILLILMKISWNKYNKESGWGCFFKVDVQYVKKLQELRNDLPFLAERMKIEKVEKLVTNLHDKTEYAMHIRNLKQALNQVLVFKKVHKVIKV